MLYFLSQTPHGTTRIYLNRGEPMKNVTHGVPTLTLHEKVEAMLNLLCNWGGVDHNITLTIEGKEVIFDGREFKSDMLEHIVIVLKARFFNLKEIDPKDYC